LVLEGLKFGAARRDKGWINLNDLAGGLSREKKRNAQGGKLTLPDETDR